MKTLKIKNTGGQKDFILSIPGSKSYAHRYIIAAALAEGKSLVKNVTYSKDIEATLNCIEAMGARVERKEDSIVIEGPVSFTGCTLNCNESASTMRFMTAVGIIKENAVTVTGSETLLNRPLTVYTDIFDEKGIEYELIKGQYLKINGGLKNGTYTVDGGVSSQFVTGLLFSLPCLEGDSEIVIKGDLASRPYVDITLEVLGDAGIEIENNNYKSFKIKGNQHYKCGEYTVQGDWSQAAFFIAYGLKMGKTTLLNLRESSLQGDRVIVDYCRKMGGKITMENNVLTVEKSDLSYNGEFDMENCPDIVPPFALICSMNKGGVTLTNTSRLKIKECDRGTAVEEMLNILGGQVKNYGDRIEITGVDCFKGNRVSSCNDHRMAMSASVASYMTDGEIEIENPMSVEKSYPQFYDDFYRTGGVLYEWNMG